MVSASSMASRSSDMVARNFCTSLVMLMTFCLSKVVPSSARMLTLGMVGEFTPGLRPAGYDCGNVREDRSNITCIIVSYIFNAIFYYVFIAHSSKRHAVCLQIVLPCSIKSACKNARNGMHHIKNDCEPLAFAHVHSSIIIFHENLRKNRSIFPNNTHLLLLLLNIHTIYTQVHAHLHMLLHA